MLSSQKSRYLLFTICLLLGLSLCTHNVRGILNNCFHATDFGIYQQAIYELANFTSPNPFLTIRNINIFNDHFDPVIYFAIPFVWAFDYHPLSLIFFELLVFVVFLVLAWKLNLFKKYNLELMVMLLTTKAFLSGLLYPIHPSTWSIIPLLLMGYFHQQKNDRGFIISTISLCLFREVFPLATLVMPLAFVIKKQYRTAIIIGLIGLFFTSMIYGLRPIILGPIENYGGLIIKELLSKPLATIAQIELMPLLKIIYPFIIPLFIVFRKNLKELYTHPLFILWLPLIGLHILTNKVHSQYGSFLIAPIWSILIFNEKVEGFYKNKKALVITILLFIASSMGTYTKTIKLAHFGKSKKCLLNQEKTKGTKDLLALTQSIPQAETIIATGGVVPLIMKPKMQIFQAGLFSKRLSQYDYLLLERNGSGDIFPYKKEDIEATIQNCSYNILMKNKFYFLAKGPIPSSCLQPLWEAWP